MKLNLQFLKEFFTDNRWEKVRAVFYFCLITIIIHVSWRFWAINLVYFPIKNQIIVISDFFIKHLYDQSLWFVKNILRIKIDTVAHSIYCENGAGIMLVESCSGVKQILQFALFLDRFFGGKEMDGDFSGKLKIIPKACGKLVVRGENH